MKTCRFCEFFAGDSKTRTAGHCGYCIPPRFVQLPYDGCPLGNDRQRIDSMAAAKGFVSHFLQRIVFQTYTGDGIPTRFYPSMDSLLRDYPGASKINAIYIDSDHSIFYRVRLPSEGEGTLSDV